MAVYTEVSVEALDAFLDNYDLGAVHSLKGIAGGVENTNYLLQVDAGSYILTLYEKRVSEADLPFFIGLMEHLSARGFSCPQPVRDRSGKALGRLEGKAAAIITFLDGIEVTRPQEDHCRMAGQTMAKLHLTAADFTIKRRNALDIDGWPSLIDATRAEADSVESGLRDLIESEMAFLQKNWPQSIPEGVIHADMFKDNVFFLNDALSGVIDFYFACNELLAYDVAIGINAWCFDQTFTFRTDLATSLVRGYQTVRPLNSEEMAALPILARGAALRFLLTRLNDWLNIPEGAFVVAHDPKAFSARLRYLRQPDALDGVL